MKRILSLFLALLMLAGCMGVSALADEPCDEHIPSEPVTENEVAASCTEPGSYDVVVYCSVCCEELSRETVTVDASGHTPGEPVIENEAAASCTEAGSYDQVVYCSVCGEELSRETVTVEAIGHEWDEGTVTLAPTTETEGVMTYNCLNCDEVMTAVLDRLPPDEHELDVTGDIVVQEEGEQLLLNGDPPDNTVSSGDCSAEGSSVNWALDGEGTLTISGSGEMKDYLEYEHPDVGVYCAYV